jgi:signal transduction histidine kinase
MEIIGLIASGGISLIFGGMVLFSQPKLWSARYFFLVTVGVGGWALGIAAFLLLGDKTQALPFMQVYYISAALIAVSMLSVAASIGKKNQDVQSIAWPWVFFGILAGAIVVHPGVLIEHIAINGSQAVTLNGVGYAVYAAYFLSLFIVTLFVLSRRLSEMTGGKLRVQLRWMFYAYGLSGVVGALFNLILPWLGNYALIWIGPLSVFIFVPVVYFTIAKYGLFELRQAAVRTIAYTFTLIVLAGTYILLGYALSFLFFRGEVVDGLGMNPINVALALLLAFIFQPIKRFFDRLTNSIFYRGQYDKDTFIRGMSKILSYDTDLQSLLRQVSKYMSGHLGADRASFYIRGKGVFGVQGLGRRTIPESDVESIAAYYQAHHEPPEVIIADNIEDVAMRRILASYRAHMVLPLMLKDDTIGYLFIGEHRSRNYTIRDISMLESIVNELTIAIQNSLSVEEIRDMNETLQHDISEATKELRASNRQLRRLDEAKDEFISMASHQLRTPLTSIKGYLDMVLDGDLGKITATQRSVLSEAYISSERMVTLINDFLNVSRLQTGKFIIDKRETDMVEMLKEQVQMLSVVAKQHGLQLDLQITGEVPRVLVDGDKVRQVMLNMIDNAIYYSAPATTIDVMLARDGDDVMFSVKDTGIGVPESEKSGLFGKFFRASNARKKRPDGTGVGLFLSRKVILAHGGDIIFWSKEGKGSVFGFRVPIGLKEADDAGDDDSATESDK